MFSSLIAIYFFDSSLLSLADLPNENPDPDAGAEPKENPDDPKTEEFPLPELLPNDPNEAPDVEPTPPKANPVGEVKLLPVFPALEVSLLVAPPPNPPKEKPAEPAGFVVPLDPVPNPNTLVVPKPLPVPEVFGFDVDPKLDDPNPDALL